MEGKQSIKVSVESRRHTHCIYYLFFSFRTLTPNSGKGTDHGWSGSSFMIGGQVKGGKILGQYPTDFSSTSPLNVGRGRLIPTMPFESMWNGVIQWFGVNNEEDLSVVLPNRKSFTNLYTQEELYEMHFDQQDTKMNCEGHGDIVSCIPTNPDLLTTDDGWDFNNNLDEDYYDLDDDDYYNLRDQSNGRPAEYVDKKSKQSIIVTVVMVVLCSFLLLVGAFIYNQRTGKLSNLQTALGIRWCTTAWDKRRISGKSNCSTVDENISFEVVEDKRGNISIITNV